MPNAARFRDPDATSSDRKKAIALHLLGLSAVIWIPVVPSLILWLITRDDSPFVADHGKEAVNFQISIFIYAMVAGVLAFVLVGFPLLVSVGILGLVGMIMACMAAKDSEYFRYPMCLRFIK
ncbi:MAG: DUF4870 domain-containing protein [Phycisphaerae bacterium]|nr:DUF4870 domain-containing protein [Phycisphaerae bacterium]